MLNEQSIRELLSQTIISLTKTTEYREMRRLNRGYDLDMERVLGQAICVDNEKRKLLLQILEETVTGDK